MKTSSKSTKAGKVSKSRKVAKPAAPKTRKQPAKTTTAPKRTPKPTDRDPRLPAVGTTLEREFKGKTIKVKITAEGFEYDGTTFKSISACARHITGYMISGPVFFRLVEPKRPEAK
jgi:hypothetical protein